MPEKQFAIDHMNKDHTLALYDYVNAYAGENLDYFNHQTTQLRLVDVTLDNLHLEWKSAGSLRSAQVPINPPMESFAQLRPTVVAMAQDAAAKLNVSPYQVKAYRHWDTIVDFLVDSSVWFLFGVAATAPNLSLYHSNPLFSLLDAHASKLALGLLVCHLAEIPLVLLPKLREHRVPRQVGWKWMVATTIGGIFAIKRFERQVPGHK